MHREALLVCSCIATHAYDFFLLHRIITKYLHEFQVYSACVDCTQQLHHSWQVLTLYFPLVALVVAIPAQLEIGGDPREESSQFSCKCYIITGGKYVQVSVSSI